MATIRLKDLVVAAFLFSEFYFSAHVSECVVQPRQRMFKGDWGCATTSGRKVYTCALLANLLCDENIGHRGVTGIDFIRLSDYNENGIL